MVFQRFEYKIKEGQVCIEKCFLESTIADIPESL